MLHAAVDGGIEVFIDVDYLHDFARNYYELDFKFQISNSRFRSGPPESQIFDIGARSTNFKSDFKIQKSNS